MHPFAVFASPESLAWRSTQEVAQRRQNGRPDLPEALLVNPFRSTDPNVLAPFQPIPLGENDNTVPRWAVYDCAEVPGAIVALLRQPVGSLDEAPFDPVAVVLATPHAEPATWHLFGLRVNGLAEHDVDSSIRVIRGAMTLLDARCVTLILPWNLTWFDALPSVAPVELLSSYTSMHGPTPAATLKLHDTSDNLPPSLPRLDLSIPTDREELPLILDRMQETIENGSRLFLCTPPSDIPGVRLHVREVPP